MNIRTRSKTTVFNEKETKVEIQVADGMFASTGRGVARCADGDEFDEETGEEIADIRARSQAFEDMLEEHRKNILELQNRIKKHRDLMMELREAIDTLEERLDYLLD